MILAVQNLYSQVTQVIINTRFNLFLFICILVNTLKDYVAIHLQLI